MAEDINSTSETTIRRIREYLKENKRFDKRKTDEFRELIIEKNISKKAEGSVRVRLGKTEVLVGVKVGGDCCALSRFSRQRKFNGYC